MGESEFEDFIGKNFFHVCTDGTSIDCMFWDDRDFVAGINRVGVCVYLTNVQLVSYVLMDNHVHFLLYGTMLQCKDFINRFKTLTGKYIAYRHGFRHYLNHLKSCIILLRSKERIINTIAYIDRNPLVAGFQALPFEYQWGSARYYFRESVSGEKCRSLAEMSDRYCCRLLNTHVILPKTWQVDSTGMLDPLCFIDLDKGMRFIKSPTRYLYFISKKLEGEIDEQLMEGNMTFIMDKELKVIAKNIAFEMFGESKVIMLELKDRMMIAKKLRCQYGSTPKQISRILKLNFETIKKFI